MGPEGYQFRAESDPLRMMLTFLYLLYFLRKCDIADLKN